MSSSRRGPAPSARQRRLGQNFLTDTNLLELIVREARVGPDTVVLEVGGGAGALTERLAPRVAHLHVVEFDETLRDRLTELAAAHPAVEMHWADAARLDWAGLDPVPEAMVANLPYSVAVPVLAGSLELAALQRWLVMVQLEIAERLAAAPGTRAYGAPSALVQHVCDVELVRRVPPEVFSPPPRVHSALVRLRRRTPTPPAIHRATVRACFAHRRKSLPRSLELAGGADRATTAEALGDLGHDPGVRAEALGPGELFALAERLTPPAGLSASDERPGSPR
ncbi:MAG: 16S rRNA (adenine(1518)-N(6)/adenine(1519)-N(6))-dimethyltransferase RsmA [Solirubrobacterales bacterium]